MKPDILVLDMSLSNYNAGVIVTDIKESHPRLHVILTSVFDTPREEPGVETADAFVLKNTDTTQLREKIFEFLPDRGLPGLIDRQGREDAHGLFWIC